MSLQSCNVTAEVKIKGANVQVGDYSWITGQQIHEREAESVLRYRTTSDEVAFEARLGDDSLQSFGQLMFFPANIQIKTSPARRSQLVRNVTLRFEQHLFADILSSNMVWDDIDLKRCLDMHNPRIEYAIQQLGIEVASPGLASMLLVESLCSVAIVEVARHFSKRNYWPKVRTRQGHMSKSDLQRIRDYIESCVSRCPSIDDIANECNISPAHLRRSFKKTTGHTVHECVEGVRLNKAKSLLADTDLPLKEISYRLGFADASTFSSTFRKTAGEPPSKYRLRTRH